MIYPLFLDCSNIVNGSIMSNFELMKYGEKNSFHIKNQLFIKNRTPQYFCSFFTNFR
jgi:hypothetical protein